MKLKESIPGIIVVLVIAVFSYFISTLHASFDALVISIIIGMFIGNVLSEKNHFVSGIETGIKIFLPAGIALYGTQLFFNELRFSSILTIFLVFSCMFSLTLIISKIFNLNRKISILLASGLSICGASAIAVISPLIGAKREDTSISIISVMMLGLIGMIFYPFLYDILSLTKNEFAFLTGTTLPMLGQVKVAAGSICPACLSTAVKIKLIRISFLIFLVTIAVFLSGKEEKKVKVPWFIIVFLVFAVIVNTTRIFEPFLEHLKNASSFFLSAALAAIGFSVDLDSMVEQGITPVAVIFLSWGVIILSTYLILSLF
ncbi:MAG: putative sulfate exporter family transporter [Nitrospirota bacterium]